MNAAAQPAQQKLGRLPDGRAYRVDEQGMRLVDHIAELEVSADDLRRQVDALQNQVREKERIIQKYEQGKAPYESPQVRETNLVPSRQRPGAGGEQPPNCNELVSNLYRRVAQLERASEGDHAAGPEQAGSAAAVSECDYDSPANPWKAEAGRLQSKLGEQDAGAAKHLNRKAEAGRPEQVQPQAQQQLQQDLEAEKRKAAALEEELARLRGESDEQRAQIASLERLRAEEWHASMPPSPTPTPPAVTERSGGVDAATLKESRKELEAALRRIQEALLKRKDLFDQVKKRGTGVSIQIQPPATKKGAALDDLRTEVRSLSPGSDIPRLREGLQEIEKMLTDDIATLQRLSKI